jgi:hypothetical protein
MEKKLPHIRIQGPSDSIGFSTPSSPNITPYFPPREREKHGSRIKKKLEDAWKESENEKVATHSERTGTYIEFQSSPGFDFTVKGLEDLRQGVRLCNVREEHTTQDNGEKIITRYATVYIPNDKKKIFSDKIKQYLSEETASGNPKNKNLIESIEELQKALLVKSFWTDTKTLMPSSEPEWCEVWLRGDSNDVITRFEALLQSQNIDSRPGCIKFPERLVKLIYASEEQLSIITRNSDDIAEYRRAKTTAEFQLSQTPAEQSKWVDDLLGRLSVDSSSNVSVCILDTGVNNAHPLLQSVLSDEDCQAVKNEWQSHDHNGHGTLMAGLVAYGDLQSKLESSNQIKLGHVLESVKILPPVGSNPVELYGYLTKQAISLAEIQAEDRKRIACMPVSSDDTRDRGRPSSWSAAIDQITSGAEDENKRLFILAAGNITDIEQIANYPDSLMTDSIHDPAQSWNAITVGAVTTLTEITDTTLSGYSALATEGQISPFSTTSLTWENNKWPLKPEVVFEGGNIAVDTSKFATECNDLSLVSTNYKPQEESLCPFNMTSAATAQAANFAAQIQVQYPDYWPETIRALMIHSAEWPEALKSQFAKNDTKTEINNVLRACGYGVPNLEKAIYCASNSLTLIAEAEIQPFEGSKTKDMHLYELPWPKEILEGLGESDVEMRITLSYFVEPGPGEIGWKDRYRYASHALRFNLNSPGEANNVFIDRISKKNRDVNYISSTSSPSDHWVIGSKNRDKGSIHSDIWRGSAADLADSNLIAISPVIGWWRERKHLGKSNKIGRYSLIVSINTPEQNVDIYTPVKIAAEIKPFIEVRS